MINRNSKIDNSQIIVMFRWYGIAGTTIILFAQFTMLLQIQPFATFFTAIVWIGYILLIDSFVYAIKGSSYLVNKRHKLFMMSLVSINFWFIFEIYNKFAQFQGWYYVNLPESRLVTFLMGGIAFTTVIPAILETSEFLGCLKLFTAKRSRSKIPHTDFMAYILFAVGVIFILLPFAVTTPWMWVYVWTGFIFLIDPILYIFVRKKSLLHNIITKNYTLVIYLMIAGYICGFLWEFWNYNAHIKWYYTVPILENIKIYEIPAVGFLAYGPFALELYVMYEFVKLLLSRKMWRNSIRLDSQYIASHRSDKQ